MKPILLLLSALVLAGCCTDQQIFQTSVVSMTKRNFSPLKEGPRVTAKWCEGDPVLVGNKGEVGLMDQAIMKAQKQKKADAILNAIFTQTDCSCMTIKGNAAFAGSQKSGKKNRKKRKKRKGA